MIGDVKLTACVTLFHSGDSVLQTIQSLKDSTVPVEIFVADNSPKESTARKILNRWPDVTVLPSPKGRNLGYGRANNLAIPHLGASTYHLVLNPDVTFEPDLLERMIAFMEAHRDVVLLSPRVFFADGTEQFLPRRQPTIRYQLGGRLHGLGERFRARGTRFAAAAGEADTDAKVLWDEFKRARGIRRLRARLSASRVEFRHSRLLRKARRSAAIGNRLCRWREEYTLQNDPPSEPMEVQFASGCFMLFRAHTFYNLHGFDPRFFLYHEDSDITMRALKYGAVVYHPDMCVVHNWKRSSAHHLIPLMHHLASSARFYHRYGWKW